MRSVYTPTYQAMLARLRQARQEAHLTQQDVARRLRRPQSWVSNCESGERRVDVIELMEFAELYSKPLLWFVRRKGNS